MSESLDNRMIFTTIYSNCDYVLHIVNLKLSPIFIGKTELPPEAIIFRTTNGEEVRYLKESNT